jgi:hypothetical protein
MGAWRGIAGGPGDWARDLAAASLVGVALSLLGPFGSYGAPYLQRLFYCVAIGWAGSVPFFPSFRLGLALGRRAGLPGWPASVAASLLGGISVTVVVWLAGPFLWTGRWRGPAQGPLLLYLQVMSIIMPLALAGGWLRRRLAGARAPAETPAPRLAARLPATVGREIFGLEAEDHYVRVHTDRGSALLLMRMADAVDELDGLEGLRVHRSWWVAKAAVRACAKEGRRMVLTLADGSKAPVTREAVPQLRRAGWV